MEKEYIRASEYAEKVGKNYRTILRHYKDGYIEGYINSYGRPYLKNPDFKREKSVQIIGIK